MTYSSEKVKDLSQVALLLMYLGFAGAVIVLGLWIGGMPMNTSVPGEMAAIAFVNAYLVPVAMILVIAFLVIQIVVAVIWAVENTPNLKDQDATRQFIREHRVEGLGIILGLVVIAGILALALWSENTLYALLAVVATAVVALALAVANIWQLIRE